MWRQSLASTARRAAFASTRRGLSTTAVRRAEVEITIDGKKVMIEQGAALIQAAEKAGITIPRCVSGRHCYIIGLDKTYD